MARTLTAYLERTQVPDLAALQQSLKAQKSPLRLDPDYAPMKTSGYLPCTLDGEDAGFDLRFRELAAGVEIWPLLQSNLGTREIVMTFKWGGDPREDAAASYVCAALARDFGAVVQDGDEDVVLSAADLLERAGSVLEMG